MGKDFSYDVHSGARHWHIVILSTVAGQDTRICEYFHTVCGGGKPLPGVLVTQLHPKPYLTVSMYAFHRSTRRATSPSPSFRPTSS